MSEQHKIIYTWTDEAPALATHAFLPIIRAFAGAAEVPVDTRDISLAGRILAVFPDVLADAQRVSDDLADLGQMVLSPEANVIKLPNISASIPQIKACIKELRGKGYPLPDYPDEPKTDAERDIKARYDKVKGSAVNPVLREGNSDRRAPASVKTYARANPPRMGAWSSDSKAHVVTMDAGDFRHNEKSVTLPAATTARIEHVAADGTVTVMKDGLKLLEGEVLDGTFMSKKALAAFFERQIADAKAQGVLFSLHMKATMMKVSDPIIFGHCVRAFYKDVFAKHGPVLAEIGANPNDGLAAVIASLEALPSDQRAAIEADIQACYDTGPGIAMVNSDKGITNLHVPSDIIIDASMPPMIRDSGRMWNAAGELQDAKAVIPDSSYAGVYAATVEDCQANGALDPATMGSVANVGLMAQKAEEYGSHDKTFEVPADGTMRAVDADGNTLIEHRVEAGDIWRACQTKDAPIRDWVKLAVNRARDAGTPAVFWLDADRAHDAELIKKIDAYLPEHDTAGLELKVMPPVDACRYSLERIRRGEDTISVTGNVLRDYLTDLFPILEVGTSARMLSIVPLMNGGGLFETGAGGSAPKHVQQFREEGHLRWDSLGEYLALAASLQYLGDMFDNPGARVLASTLDEATGTYLLNNRSPQRKVGQLDNRGSCYFLTRYWAESLAKQDTNTALAERFKPVAEALIANEEKILAEIDATQGKPQDLGGYYRPEQEEADAAMRPSRTLNEIIASV
ncbi:isocitrate dehydrogenase, NADP-dependent, monomeric type [Thioflavicoccus mobilis 8321]|uniref:Isocitrate dehydrogenase [NADP] n=1 Tax=Thioflavicoccus mobilis 8321 TaxID=765912 RepID=L0GSZ1_9GAMM|nr:NADP-dependent isocitrate dehydrogenase [Thioflavicoccus mobilis]AGA89116.1 isocitrate dehydrogenase, NADP-dependent, monomeric type [Thioflavicoccus mobilis 8321]